MVVAGGAGNVASVDTRGMGGGGFHYDSNGATYARVGDAMGRAMVGLLNKRSKQQDAKSKKTSEKAAPNGESKKKKPK